MTDLYESGGVNPPRFAPEVWNTCSQCGATWFGNQRAVCSECATAERLSCGASDLDILRRIAERGLKLAQSDGLMFIDIFQHMLDEIKRVPPNA